VANHGRGADLILAAAAAAAHAFDDDRHLIELFCEG
jgi:hypothetical protein